MKYMKMLGVAAITVMAAAFAGYGSAFATELTSPHGTMVVPGTNVHMFNESHITLHPPIGDITCGHFTIEGKTSTTGGSTETVKVNVEIETFGECNATVSVLAKGSLEIHTDNPNIADGNGILTSTGTEATVEFLGFHCIFKTNGTKIGTITTYTSTGTNHATVDLSGALPRTGGRSGAFCGTTAEITGSLTVTTPVTLSVD